MRTHHEISESLVAMPLPSERSFGLLFGGLFAALGFFNFQAHRPIVAGASFLAAIAFLTGAMLKHRWLRPLNRAWIQLSAILARLSTPVVLFVLFFLVVCPVALLLRLLGKQPLSLKLDRKAKTYWVVREKNSSLERSMKNQF